AGLAVLLVATALSAADAADDLRVLEAVGAPPRVLRRRAAAHTAYLALLGCALAVPAGLIPAFGVVALADVDVAFVVPWREVALAVVTLPLLSHAATLWFDRACGLPSRSNTPRPRLQMLLTLALLAPVQGSSDDLVLESYVASLDGGQTLEGRIGRLSVPELHAEPDGPKIEIAFAVYDARTDDPGPPIFFLAGGPGAPGIDLAAELAANEELDLLARHAVVGIDQRGTGQSFPNLGDGPAFRYSLPLDRPVTRDEMAEAFREAVGRAAAHWSEEGIDLAAYNSAESADDVDAVRRALGYDQVILWGTSYGSHLGLAALRRHGEHVERAVLSKVEGPDDTFKLPSLVQKRLDHVAALIAADPELGERFPDFVGSIRTLLERLAAEPVTVPTVLDGEEVEVVVGPLDVQVLLSSALGFAPQVATLPMAVALMEEGEFRHVARFVAGLRRGEVGSAMAIATDCASGSSEARRERLADELGDPANVLGDGISAPFFPEACAGCPDPAVGTALRAPLRSDVPVLFVSGELDARTPPENVEALLDGFGAAVHVVATHTGHEGTEWGSDEFVGVVRSFLAGESVRSVTVELPPIAFRPVRPK
ncbi:MAG: alpha/beta fold hydrolase, partial [Planctomycetota bacterium]